MFKEYIGYRKKISRENKKLFEPNKNEYVNLKMCGIWYIEKS